MVASHRAPNAARSAAGGAPHFGASLEILWAVYLGWRLPRHYVADHWALAWVGLDVAEIVMLFGAAWAAWRQRAVLIVFSIAAATLFLLDAWFDVTTANHGDELQSVVLAVFVEVPSATVAALGRSASGASSHRDAPCQ